MNNDRFNYWKIPTVYQFILYKSHNDLNTDGHNCIKKSKSPKIFQ